MIAWIKKYRVEFILILLVLAVAAFFRLYRISEYMMFLGDEGRDVMVVRRLLVNFDPIFVGPGTSVGNMYLGPLYYYLMAPALWIANYSPVGPAVQIALLGVITTLFVWYVSRLWTNKVSALLVSILYAVSPVVVFYSRSSWNPNIMPFFSLLTIFSLWKIWKEGKWKWTIVLALSLAFVSQSHYLGLLLLPTVGIFWLSSMIKAWGKKETKKTAILYTTVALLIIILLSLPLALFDAKYNWRNIKSFETFMFSRGGDFAFRINIFLSKIWKVWEEINTRILASTDIFVGRVLSVGILFIGAFFAKRKLSSEFILVLSWIVFGVLGLVLYKGEVYDHYLGFLYPAIFILFAMVLKNVFSYGKIKVVRFLPFLLTALLFILSIQHSAFKNEPNRQLQRTMAVAQKIKDEAGNNKYNIAVIASKNYEGAYQYFLEMWRTQLSIIDPQRYEETVANQLFVICEYEDQSTCHPTSNPKAEVANYGWSKIDKEWNVWGLKLFKLVKNPRT